MSKIFDNLNESQIEAVKSIDGPLLILAGAGSGKTKTITSRLAYLIEAGIDPRSTLTLTFTNKAANEMRERALHLIDNYIYPPLLCTFHKFGLIFLKMYISKIGRNNSFVVIDTDDKKRVLKGLAKDTQTPISLIASEISRYKNSLITPKVAIENAELKLYKEIANLYKEYQNELVANNLVDFDDLLVITYNILENDLEFAKEFSNRYQYIMVDEYQDTNDLQFKLLQKLTTSHKNLCVVGDDDQSIYGWRGANIKNILDFPEIFDDTKVIKLEYNYRSSGEILEAANNLIEHNRDRLGKKLVCTKGKIKPISLFESEDETSEALKIAKAVKELLRSGEDASEIAILYRINALSRSIEEGLNKEGVSYKLVGGIKFYERAEIKDIISYLRCIANPNDDFSAKELSINQKEGLAK